MSETHNHVSAGTRDAVQAILEDEVYFLRFEETYDYGDAVERIMALIPTDAQPTLDSIRVELDSCRAAVSTIEANRTGNETQNRNYAFYQGKVAGLEFALASQPSPAATVETGMLGRENDAFHRALRKYPDAFEALHSFWNEAFAGQPQSRSSAGTVDVAKIREWADDFEAAAGDVPKGIKSTVLMTRAQEVRSYIDQLTSAPGRASTLSALDDASNACLELAKKHGFATGHGDTVADMIREFSAQIANEPQAPQESGLKRALELLIKLQVIGDAQVYRLASEAHQMLTLPISRPER